MPHSFRRLWAPGLLALLLPGVALAQGDARISGTVRADNGSPVAGASVTIVAPATTTTTRVDGTYTLVVPAARAQGQQVQVTARLVGFKASTRTITLSPGDQTLDFELAQNPLQLGEIVTTGAGTQAQIEALGTQRTNVDTQLVRRSAEPSLINALAAKAPNVQISGSSGEAGSSAFITIRGIGTYAGNAQPLFVIDGLPVDNSAQSTTNFDANEGSGPITGTAFQSRLSDLNPNDVENVEILKGPAASSIYGARGANGVIIITTKKGAPGTTRWSLRSNLTLDQVNNEYPLQTSWGQGRFGADPAIPGGKAACTPDFPQCYRSWGASTAGGTVYDHFGELFNTGVLTDNTLTVSGGTERTQFLLSGGYTYNDGYIINNNDAFDRISVRLNASQMIGNNFKVLGNFQYAKTKGQFIQRGNNVGAILLGGLRTPPEFNNEPFIDPATGYQRAYAYPNAGPDSERESRLFDNPIWAIDRFVNQAEVGRVFGNVGVEWQALNWLKINYTLGADYANDERLEAFPLQSSESPNGKLIQGNFVTEQWDHNLVAIATHSFSQKFNGTLSVGQNLNQRETRANGVVGRDFITPEPYTLQNTVTRDQPVVQQTRRRLEGYFAQATVDWDDQLFLTGGLRYDGASSLSPASNRSWFPKASAAWTFTRAMGESDILSFGKLRAAYGEAGIEPAPYLFLNTVSSAGPFSGGVQGVGLNPTQGGVGGVFTSGTRAATDLKYERAKEWDLGFDLGLFKDRVDLGFTWYNKKSTDAIIPFPVAPSTGFFQEFRNAGTIQNKGVEVTANWRAIQNRDWNVQIGGQFSRNRSKVLDIAGFDGDTTQFVELPGAFLVSQVLQIGQPYGIMRGQGFVRCGISAPGSTPDFDAACAGAPTGALYIDSDGFPLLDPDLRKIADPNYDWEAGLRALVGYRKLQVTGLLDIRNGGQIWNGTKGALYSYGTHRDTEQRASCDPTFTCTGNEKTFGQGGWFDGPVVGPGAGTAVPIGENWYRVGIGTTFAGNDEIAIEDAGFVRLREVTVQYTFDTDFVRRTLGLSSIDVRIGARNLLTWTDYTGLDPETNLSQAEGVRRGIDYFNQPQSRSWVFGVTINR